jgi:2-keto-4-pentenoate hydratase/2-oxohepta-3-ene-1,7-dioic acid hydratase in catechol pathway
LASTDCARGTELGLLTSIGSGAVLDRAFWFAFLQPGDVFEVEIKGMGVLSNPVQDE